MRKDIWLTLLGVLTAVFVFAQSEETRRLSSFSKISANEGINVFIKQGNKEEARIVAKNIDIEDVLTEVKGSTLKIHLNDNWRHKFSRKSVDVYVTYRSIEALSVSSSGTLVAETPVKVNEDFQIEVSSSGDIEADITADNLSIEASSAGDATLTIHVDEVRCQSFQRSGCNIIRLCHRT